MNFLIIRRSIVKHFLLCILFVILAGIQMPALAQFGNLLKQLEKAVPQQSAQNQQVSSNRRSGGLVPSEKWCQVTTGSLGKLKVDTSVIASEFKIVDLDSLQDDFRKVFLKSEINKTFPGVGFFRASFETERVRAIYDTFLGFPEPATLAALIQLSRSNDPQERPDAVMALTFIHLQAQELSVNKDRWWQLFQSVKDEVHYTVLSFKARLNTYGEYGPKNLQQALADISRAGGLQNNYSLGEGGVKKEFDTQNYQMVTQFTAFDIFRNEPNAPYRRQWEPIMKIVLEIEKEQEDFAKRLPSTRVGSMYAEANKLNLESVKLGDEIIRRTQGGNQLLGALESLKSLRSTAPGDKPVFEDISADIQAEQLKMFAKLGTLDAEQKQLLIKAQERRLLAQGIIAQSYGELFRLMTSNMSSIPKMAAPLPALTQANNALIQSCIISSKWEQAMRARDVPKPDIKKTEAMVSDLQSRYKD